MDSSIDDYSSQIEDFGNLANLMSQRFGVHLQMNEECQLLQQVDFQLNSSRLFLQESITLSKPLQTNEDIDECDVSFESEDELINNKSQQAQKIEVFDKMNTINENFDVPDTPKGTLLSELSINGLKVSFCKQELQIPLTIGQDTMRESIDSPTTTRPTQLPQNLPETIFNKGQKLKSEQNVVQSFSRSQKIYEIHRQYQPIKEGFLYKKSVGLLGGFDKRYFILTNSKLFQFNCDKKLIPRGVINFRIAICEVLLQKEKVFSIYIQQQLKPFIFRGLTQKDAADWADIIQSTIQLNKCNRKAWIKSINMKEYLENDCMTEEEFTEYAETGDILLFKTNNFASKIQRGLTGSKFDHVGMVVKFNNQEIRVFDSNGDTGVTLLPWSEFVILNNLYEKYSLRKLNYTNKRELDTNIYQFVGESLGKKYLLNFEKLLKKQSLPRKPSAKQQEEGFFCSELVAKALKKCGLLDPIRSSCQYWPVDFTQERKIKLLRGATLTNEISIIVRNHRYI